MPPVPPGLRRDILAEANDDYLGLWWILLKVDQHLPGLSADVRRHFTVAFLKDLLSSGLLVAGDLQEGDPEFAVRPGSAVEVMNRIEEDWHSLQTEPSLGDVVWFAKPLSSTTHPC